MASVLVSGEGNSSMGCFCQSVYSRGKSAFSPARRASTKLDSQAPVSQELSSLVLGGCCPATAMPSLVETYGMASGPVKPKREKSPCGFDHSLGTMIPASAGAGSIPVRSNCAAICENFRNSTPCGRSLRSQVVSPNWVSCGERRYGTFRYCSGAASVKHHRRKPFAPAPREEYMLTRSNAATASGVYCADEAPISWIMVGRPAPPDNAVSKAAP